jgi:hypothetical protein
MTDSEPRETREDERAQWAQWDAWVQGHINNALAAHREHLASDRAYLEQLIGEVLKRVYEDVASGLDKLRGELQTLRRESRRERKQDRDKLQVQIDAKVQRVAAIADRVEAHTERRGDLRSAVAPLQEEVGIKEKQAGVIDLRRRAG